MLGIKSMITLGLVAVIAVAAAICFRNCRTILYPPKPRPPRIATYGPYEVVSVDGGASMTVKTGRKRERSVTLEKISPPDDQWADISKKHLAEMAGGKITVRIERRGILRSVSDEESAYMSWYNDHYDHCDFCRLSPGVGPQICQEAKDRHDRMQERVVDLEAKGPLVGVCFGESGINLNLEQVKGGYAVCSPDAPKDWIKAQAEAKTAKKGLWSEAK